MRNAILAAATFGLIASAASAQLPGLSRRGPGYRPEQPVLLGVEAMRADFMAKSGSANVYFGSDSAQLGAPARATLVAQATWLRQHPELVVRVEGHGDPGDTRDHALAVGARRAEEVRDYLVLLGVPAAQLSVTSWGKEQPGPPRTVTVLLR
jgi:peptidoglycan-associated lipoprotein